MNDILTAALTIVFALCGMCIVVAVPTIAIVTILLLEQRATQPQQKTKDNLMPTLPTPVRLTDKSSRDEILTALMARRWFVNTSLELRDRITSLDDSFNGYIADLANRPEVLEDGTEQLSIVELHIAPYGSIVTVFWVKTPAGLTFWDQTMPDGTQGPCRKRATYEYFSWKSGVTPGAKGLVRILDINGKVTHIVMVIGTKFATNRREVGAIGGFGSKAWKTFIAELVEELGFTSEPKVLARHELSTVTPDSGQGNQSPLLYCADISSEDAKKIGEVPNPDEWEMHNIGPLVVAVTDIGKLITATDEGYLFATLLRMANKGLLDPKYLVA